VVARRCLSYLSGGHIVSILKDILYDDEKDRLADRYRLAITRIGDAIKYMKPKPKGVILNAVRQAGFTKDDLRERGWTFSSNLWKSCSMFSNHSNESFPHLVPRTMTGMKQMRPRMKSLERHVITETSFRRSR
jgi:hypothetical protein